MTREEFINEINNNKYYSLHEVKNSDAKLVDCGLHYSSHGWYSIAVNVYEVEDGYVGIQGVNSCSNSYSYKDIDILCEAFPMKKISTYIKE